MDCHDLLAYLSDYLDRELDEDLTQAAREHLSTCNDCKVVVNTMEKTISLVHDFQTKSIPLDRKEALFDRIEAVYSNKIGNSM